MRELNIGTKRFTKILVLDEPGQGGACHSYQVHDNHPADDYQGSLPFALNFAQHILPDLNK
jgi:hypothetical protein